jgi:hypothetical protein
MESKLHPDAFRQWKDRFKQITGVDVDKLDAQRAKYEKIARKLWDFIGPIGRWFWVKKGFKAPF